MDDELLRKVRDALNARVTGSCGVNIVIPVSENAAHRALDILETALKSGLWDKKEGILDADGTNVPKGRLDDGADRRNDN